MCGQSQSIPISAPPFRRLRVYAFDPSVALRMETAVINRVVLNIPWETDLKAGPVGEYLEVVDADPASACFYEPVDLNHPFLLAEDGLEPSDGNPQFHQQMVYAVAMTTIRHFERALGRCALWSPRRSQDEPDDEKAYVPRLRLYPHALREANAYYSPQKKALLFGYFPASSDDPGNHLPGGTVFTCLSHDVVAHETTHALLDGMHRRFNEASNPDVLAFHEAFADTVALLQHFSMPDVLRDQIARTRGDLASQSLLGQLAQEFGQATGCRGALRDALGGVNAETGQWEAKKPDPRDMETTLEPHSRGGLLVAAVFDAFLSIYRSRVTDLLRIATGGSGVLPAGALHPDLVNRLASEAAKSARHVLTMCIRALDYCPPVDLTFGEYLRALITADYDLIPDDSRNYRIAVIEAFRRRGIYPREMRTLSVDSLRWQAPRNVKNEVLPPLALPVGLQEKIAAWDLTGDRRQASRDMRKIRSDLHDWLFSESGPKAGERSGITEWQMGLDLSKGETVEVHSVRPARRIGPDGQHLLDMIVEITQRRPEFLDPSRDNDPKNPDFKNPDFKNPDFWFRGGCTLVVDMQNERGKIRYCIAKYIDSLRRIASQRRFLADAGENSLRATYFGNPLLCETAEPFAMLHRSPVEEQP